METDTQAHTRKAQWPPRILRNLSIRYKLVVGFGGLVGLTLIVIALSFFASAEASSTIRTSSDVRQPTSLAASQAQANLLRMFADVRGYLALGDPIFLESYRQGNQAFRADLERLEALSHNLGATDQQRLVELREAFERWNEYPDQLFALRDDQMDREPAYALLNTMGTELGGSILINTNRLIALQAQRDPSRSNNELLRDMAAFQSSFSAMFSGLRGYVMTRNTLFRYYEFEINREINQEIWERLARQEDSLTSEQQTVLATIAADRETFLDDVPEPAFAIMESPSWRLDLELFSTEVVALTNRMQQLLGDLTESQQLALQRDLARGNESLNLARLQTVLGGAAAVLMGVLLAFTLGRDIAGPVRRLTSVAEKIRTGDLTALARVESADEIGVFAATFNNMTLQLRKEKKRASDLLNVVIPIGVALTSERDFQRLLERILVDAMEFCFADGGVLFLREDTYLRCMLLRLKTHDIVIGGASGQQANFKPVPLFNEVTGEQQDQTSIGYTALHGEAVNIANIADDSRFRHHAFADIQEHAPTRQLADDLSLELISQLVIPLKNNDGDVVGVLALANAHEPETEQVIPFDANLQQMMESYSSLAVAALEAYIREQSLRQEIQELRIEIDEVKRQKHVSEIVDTELFQDLQTKARAMRKRRRRGGGDESDHQPDDTA